MSHIVIFNQRNHFVANGHVILKLGFLILDQSAFQDSASIVNNYIKNALKITEQSFLPVIVNDSMGIIELL